MGPELTDRGLTPDELLQEVHMNSDTLYTVKICCPSLLSSNDLFGPMKETLSLLGAALQIIPQGDTTHTGNLGPSVTKMRQIKPQGSLVEN